MKTRFALFLSAVLPMVGHTVPLTGTAYDKDSHHQHVLFEWQRLETPVSGGLTIKTVFTSPDNSIAATEDVLTENGKIKTYTVHQNQLGETGTMEVKDGKIHFSYTKEGKVSTNEEDLPDNLIIGPTLVDYLTQRKDLLLRGESVAVRFAVLDRKETVGFKFFKDSEGSFEGKPSVVIKMKPSSFVIAAIVDPLYFTFLKDEWKLAELVGRTIPKQKRDGKWKDLDADILYHWK